MLQDMLLHADSFDGLSREAISQPESDELDRFGGIKVRKVTSRMPAFEFCHRRMSGPEARAPLDLMRHRRRRDRADALVGSGCPQDQRVAGVTRHDLEADRQTLAV